MTVAEIVVDAFRWWLALGGVVTVVFLTIGIDRVDEDARGAYAFRVLLVPGVLLIWPLVLWRWVRIELKLEGWAARYRPPRAVHLPTAIIFAVAVVIAIATGLAVRQSWPGDIAPQLLEAPDA